MVCAKCDQARESTTILSKLLEAESQSIESSTVEHSQQDETMLVVLTGFHIGENQGKCMPQIQKVFLPSADRDKYIHFTIMIYSPISSSSFCVDHK